MAGKTFINQTTYELTVELTSRLGDTPGHEGRPVNFKLQPQAQSEVLFGDDKNPYLDAIMVKARGEGNMWTSVAKVLTRGSTIDNNFNTNDHVIFNMTEDSLVTTFRNG